MRKDTEKELRQALTTNCEDIDGLAHACNQPHRIITATPNEMESFISTHFTDNRILEEEIKVIQEGIDACKEDCGDAEGKELHYIHGKSQALKIIGGRLQSLLGDKK